MKEWTKWLIILGFVLESVLLAHFYAQYQLVRVAVGAIQTDLQAHIQTLNGQCQGLLERQGFEVSKPPPPVVEEPQEEKPK